jgi:hypothetical protein
MQSTTFQRGQQVRFEGRTYTIELVMGSESGSAITQYKLRINAKRLHPNWVSESKLTAVESV